MINSLIHKCKHFLITLRFSILSIFVTLFVSAILLLIILGFMHSVKLMRYTATNLLHEVTKNVYYKFSEEIQKSEHDGEFSAKLIQQRLVNTDDIGEMTSYTYDLAKLFSIADSAYWSDEQGNLIEAKYEKDDAISSQIIDRNHQPAVRYYIYRDLEGKTLKQVNVTDLSLDPRTRPWYLRAKEAKKTVWTDIYLFKEKNILGITLATPVFKENGELRGVFGLDVRLDWLSWYISQQKISENALIFIVTKDGEIIAFPRLYENHDVTKLINIHGLSMAWLGHAFDIFKTKGQQDFSFVYDGKTYLAVFKDLPEFAMHGWLIGVVVPEDDFIGNLKKNSLMDVGIGFVILFLGITLVSGLITRIVKPIKKLVKETEKIKHFELDETEHVHSRIKEVFLLADALRSMRSGLLSFKKYVPATLVRQLIETGEHAVIGGTKRQLTIFFSDIENFTAVAEKTDPNLLMEHLCEYFDALSKIISMEQGTIDKYIGDSIMAFWGAPLAVDDPNQKAARAALECMRQLDELNIEWMRQGRQALVTRIGLHLGDVIVGNVGSMERMNYTAVGDPINVASRLEGSNKVYGTRILVSEAVFERIQHQFILRKIDCVALKGKMTSGNIYELLAENNTPLSFDINKYQSDFELGFAAYQNKSWIEAITYFENCLKTYPSDTVALVFIKRCRHFQINPPKNWDGVWRTGEVLV